MVGITAKNFLIERLGLLRLAFFLQPCRFRGLLVLLRRKKAGKQLAHRALGNSAGKFRRHLTVLEYLHRRDSLDVKKGRQVRVLIHVYLSQDKLSALLFGDPFQHWPQNTTRSTPGRPKIHHHWNLVRSEEHTS